MMFNIPYIADWTDIGKRRQALVDQNNARENNCWIDFDYAVGQKVLLKKDGILRKAEDKHSGPYVITQCTRTEQSGFNANCVREITH